MSGVDRPVAAPPPHPAPGGAVDVMPPGTMARLSLRLLSRVAAVLAVMLAVPAQAQPASLGAERCLQPDAMPMAARCELRHRYCARPPNDAWRTRWRAVCGGEPGAALIGTATVQSSGGRRAFEASAEVIWLPKAGSRTEYVPIGTLTFVGKSGDCSGREVVDLGPDDGELEVKPGARGVPTHYRGVGFKAMDIRVVCPRAAGVITGGGGAAPAKDEPRRGPAGAAMAGPPVAWFNTAEDFRAVQDGLLQGEMKDPEGIWTWRWRFKP